MRREFLGNTLYNRSIQKGKFLMVKFMLGLAGLVIFIAGLVVLFLAWSPRFLTETRELGGASTTQQIVALDAAGAPYTAENLPDLPVTLDGQAVTSNSINAQPVLEGAALGDVSGLDAPEAAAVETLNSDQQVGGQNLVINKTTEVEVVPLNVASVSPVDLTGQGGAGIVGRVEQRTVTLEFPRSLRVGGSGSIKLTLKALASGQLGAVPEIPNNAVIATPILLTDYYDTHTAAFTASLSAPDLQTEALTPATQILERGGEGVWRWSIDAPDKAGSSVLIFNISVLWMPRSSGVASQLGPLSIWGQAVQIDTDYVFGSITVPQASLLGSLLAVVGFVGQSPLLLNVLGFLWRRRSSRRRQRQARQPTRR